ncbi:MAG: glycosyltransferase family 2 protein [Gammaproteobacteria bacterium]|nr:glycosyltransferase family 2 protein [Gammaproteobacteria bacterium]
MTAALTVPLAIVSPVRNEAKYVRFTLEAMLAQTVQPQEWLFVDDGSTDDTKAIIEAYAERHPWIRVISRENRGFRQLGSGVVAAFDFGCAHLRSSDYQYIAKLDGDMSFPPRYIEVMLHRLDNDSRLAAVSGKVFRPVNNGYVEEFIIDEMVAGQFKLYKREAFERIGGFTRTILWDGIDMHRCRMKGYTTLSFHDAEARLIHHRLMGSSDQNVYRGRVRLGRGIWFMGYHPLYAVASGLFRMHERPYLIGGLIIVGSYFYAALRREPRFDDPEFIRELQRWQLRQLRDLPIRFLKRDARDERQVRNLD